MPNSAVKCLDLANYVVNMGRNPQASRREPVTLYRMIVFSVFLPKRYPSILQG